MAGDRRAHPSRPHGWHRTAVPHDKIALGLAVELVDGEVERGAAPFDQVLAEAFTAARQRPQLDAGGAGSGSAQELERRWRHEDVADLVTRDQMQRLGGIELPR